MNGNGEILAWFLVPRKTSWLSALIKCGILCPTVMVHMMCVSVSETAQQDLECVARTFFKMDNQTGWVEWGRDHCQTPEKVHQSHAVGDLKQAKDDLTFSHFSAHFCVNEKKSSVTTPSSFRVQQRWSLLVMVTLLQCYSVYCESNSAGIPGHSKWCFCHL